MEQFNFNPVLQKENLTVTEFAKLAGVSRATAHTWLRTGRVPVNQMYRLKAHHPQWFK